MDRVLCHLVRIAIGMLPAIFAGCAAAAPEPAIHYLSPLAAGKPAGEVAVLSQWEFVYKIIRLADGQLEIECTTPYYAKWTCRAWDGSELPSPPSQFHRFPGTYAITVMGVTGIGPDSRITLIADLEAGHIYRAEAEDCRFTCQLATGKFRREAWIQDLTAKKRVSEVGVNIGR